MAHVLIMAAFQLGHPVTFFIEMKSSDLSLHYRSYPPAPRDAKLERKNFTAGFGWLWFGMTLQHETPMRPAA